MHDVRDQRVIGLAGTDHAGTISLLSLLYISTRGRKKSHEILPGRDKYGKFTSNNTLEGARGEFGPTLTKNQQKYGNLSFGW